MRGLYRERSDSRAESRGGRSREISKESNTSRADIGLDDSGSNYSFLSSVPKRHPSRNRFFTPKIIKDIPPPRMPEPIVHKPVEI
jgi:hypothetical protein